MNRRDQEILKHILRYCHEVELAIQYFGDNKEKFFSDPVYRNAISMPIQQIGELAKHLSDEFVESHTQIPWKQIKGMRTWFAHQYMMMDMDIIWDVAHSELDELIAFCSEMLLL